VCHGELEYCETTRHGEKSEAEMDGSPNWVELDKGKYELRIELPRQGLALIRLTW